MSFPTTRSFSRTSLRQSDYESTLAGIAAGLAISAPFILEIIKALI